MPFSDTKNLEVKLKREHFSFSLVSQAFIQANFSGILDFILTSLVSGFPI